MYHMILLAYQAVIILRFSSRVPTRIGLHLDKRECLVDREMYK